MIKKVKTYNLEVKEKWLLSVEVFFCGILIYVRYNHKVNSDSPEFKDYTILS